MNIALIRHGKTPSNIRGAFTGSKDDPLAREGADELATRRYPEAELVFSSPMRRCVETSGIIYPGLDIIIVDGLRERNFGDFEGKTHAEIIALPGYENWGMTEESMVFPNSEDYWDFSARCCRAFQETVEQARASGAKSAAIVCHGGVIMAVLAELASPKRGQYDWICGNGCGYVLDCRDEGVKVKGSIGD